MMVFIYFLRFFVGTPINRAPILGGKDIDMFRLYNLVQEYGGKKRVTENNMWRKIMCKLHLEGCPGANPRKVQNAYSRFVLIAFTCINEKSYCFIFI